MKTDYYDSYFLDNNLALKVANQQNRVKTKNPHVDGLQICYYSGKRIKNAPKNCIFVPLENFVEYFSYTPNRFPQKIYFENSDLVTLEQQQEFQLLFDQAKKTIEQNRLSRINNLFNKISKQQLNFNDEKLRIFIPACRETTVMQYVSKDIATYMQSKNFEVLFYIQDELGNCNLLSLLEQQYKFNPHIIIQINHIDNQYLNKDIFNFVWFQDAMPILTDKKPIILRDRDFIFSYAKFFTKMLIKNNVSKNKIFKQDVFPVDTNQFYYDKNITKKDKIVFVGSYYNVKDRILQNLYISNKLDSKLKQFINQGKILTPKKIKQLLIK